MDGVGPAIVGIWVAVALCSCSAPGPSTPPAAVPGVTVLWADVPAFADSTPDLQTNELFNGSSSESMSMDYHTHRSPAEVAAFYTDAVMKQNGWSPQPYGKVNRFSVGHGLFPDTPAGQTAGGCAGIEFHGKPAALCTFSKTDEVGRNVELGIFIGPDDKSDQTMIDYIRFVGSAPKK